ncbi:hypothetical protein QDY63_14660 [Pseudomonas brenneri]|uniref:hypothetical protein n=1 Tax=Pseudomonas brenneri TaxID=129817 RepID=UPI0025A2D211|nr:hypothetical protein [Pseudomonas brenneri]WJM94055.1 hypothetical protein QDY63_14660 [Pseudomonas brenneri]
MAILKELDDGTEFVKAKYYEGETLKGYWKVYRKVDGVRVMRNAANEPVSRAGKPLYNVNHLEFKDAEVYSINWNTSVSLVRSQTPQIVTQDMIYELTDGNIDPRLLMGTVLHPDDLKLKGLMQLRLDQGDEGLILRQLHKSGKFYVWLKVVPKKQADVRITGFKEGAGRLKGTLGSIQTKHGSVGSGFDDELRDQLWTDRTSLMGTIIQVEYREVTEAGKLRFPAFVRQRFDKTEESI